MKKRRLLDTLDSFTNWLFGLLVLFVILCSLTFVFDTDISLFKLTQIIINLLAGIEIIIFVVEIILSISAWATDYSFSTGTMIWALIRTILSAAMVITLNLLNRILSSGVSVSLSINQ